MPHPGSEAAPELETIALFEKLGYITGNCYSKWNSGTSNLGRETKSEVVLIIETQAETVSSNAGTSLSLES
jgi:type I restriction enzyme, R subunit